MRYATIAAALVGLAAPPLHADELQIAMQRFVEENLGAWANDPMLVEAIRAQNAQTAGYSQAKIIEMDQLWRGYAGLTDAEIITNVTQNPAASFLREQVARADGAITEAFIMDAKGLNVAASNVTSDYWQGDEAKFTATFLVGAEAVHFGDVELDKSTNQVQGQISMTIVDPATGEPVGALTVGVNLTALM